ncbi:MAG: DUF5652 family protein [Candidatus Nomurabacteria bacterium]|nr:DUF5652 family protein [Candidatus Nomurabacteria bacterium]
MPTRIQILLIVITIWEMIWKGFALWKAAQKSERNWFIALLVLNTIGILPIFYLLIRKDKEEKRVEKSS